MQNYLSFIGPQATAQYCLMLCLSLKDEVSQQTDRQNCLSQLTPVIFRRLSVVLPHNTFPRLLIVEYMAFLDVIQIFISFFKGSLDFITPSHSRSSSSTFTLRSKFSIFQGINFLPFFFICPNQRSCPSSIILSMLSTPSYCLRSSFLNLFILVTCLINQPQHFHSTGLYLTFDLGRNYQYKLLISLQMIHVFKNRI